MNEKFEFNKQNQILKKEKLLIRLFVKLGLAFFILLPLKIIFFAFEKEQKVEVKISNARADILDCDGKILAVNIPTKSVYVVPYELSDKQADLIKLSKALNLSLNFLQAKFNTKSKFIWIKRHVSEQEIKNILSLNLKGIYLHKDVKRFYPTNTACMHIIGQVDDDGNGICGIEKAYDARLKSDLNPLILSLNSFVQFALQEALDQALIEAKAKSVNGMIINLKTGEIVGIYSKNANSSENVHEGYKIGYESMNLNTQCVFELGSILKIVNAAMLIESGFVKNLNEKYFAPSVWHFGKHKIKDSRPRPDCYFDFQEAFIRSSNVVHGMLAYKIGLHKQIAFFVKCGFYEKMYIDKLNVTPPIIVKKWKAINGITAAYGYGIALNAAYFLRACLRIITAEQRQLYIEKKNTDSEKKYDKLFSSNTSKKILILLEEAGKASLIGEYANLSIGGKTGTGNKLVKGAYQEGKNYCSYFFVFPANNPAYIGLITVAEPGIVDKWIVGNLYAKPYGLMILKKIIPVLVR